MYAILIVLVILAVVVFFPAMIIRAALKPAKKTQPNDVNDAILLGYGNMLRPSFRLVAIGGWLAFLPAAFGILSIDLGFGLYSILGFPVSTVFFLQGIGALIMLAGFSKGYRVSRGMAMPTGAFSWAIVGSFLGLVFNWYSLLTHGDEVDWYLRNNVSVFILITAIMAISFIKFSNRFSRFKLLSVASVFLDIVLLFYFVYFDVRLWRPIGTMLMIAMFVVGFSLVRVARANPLKDGEDIAPASPKTTDKTTDNKSRVVEAQTVPVTPKHTAATPDPVEKDTDILHKLMGYDDARLQKIISSPRLYNPEVITKAAELLARRNAWEQIKDLPDNELFDITTADRDLCDPNIVEAAAMELFQRNSQLLRNQFNAMTPDTLAAIANGTTPAPEGIRLAAQRSLSKHI